jgi:Icc-related predicted phosphoesterase
MPMGSQTIPAADSHRSDVVKILAVSDKVMEAVYSPAITRNFGDVDLVIGCGDLPFYYLDFIISSLNVPCYFVYGNHDLNVKQTSTGVATVHPPGWVNLDNRIVCQKGLLLAGFEGSLRYRPDGAHQYTQMEAQLKLLRFSPALILNRLRHRRHVDVFAAHSPPFGIHDGPDYAHTGFTAFLTLMDRFRPRYLLHGHKHTYGTEPVESVYNATKVINVYPYRVIELTAAQPGCEDGAGETR